MKPREKLSVLIPLDGSDPAQSALLAISPLLRSGPVDCTLLHVSDTGKPSREMEAQLELHRESLQSLKVPVRIRYAAGQPSQAILASIGSGEFDLVAMTTHGRQGWEHVTMGSVAEDVVRSSSIPSILCRRGTPSPAWNRIVVALDGQPEAEGILEDVLLLAPRVGATVHLLQVHLTAVPANSYRGVTFGDVPAESSTYLDTVADRLAAAGVRVVTDHGSGLAAKEIVLIATDLGADLICTTTRGLPEESPGLGRSVTAEVIRNAPCPVYVRRMHGSLERRQGRG